MGEQGHQVPRCAFADRDRRGETLALAEFPEAFVSESRADACIS